MHRTVPSERLTHVYSPPDETPVGVFVEIEGSDPGIMSMAEALGRTSADYIVDSYRTLFLQLRDQCGLAGTDMVFEES